MKTYTPSGAIAKEVVRQIERGFVSPTPGLVPPHLRFWISPYAPGSNDEDAQEEFDEDEPDGNFENVVRLRRTNIRYRTKNPTNAAFGDYAFEVLRDLPDSAYDVFRDTMGTVIPLVGTQSKITVSQFNDKFGQERGWEPKNFSSLDKALRAFRHNTFEYVGASGIVRFVAKGCPQAGTLTIELPYDALDTLDLRTLDAAEDMMKPLEPYLDRSWR